MVIFIFSSKRSGAFAQGFDESEIYYDIIPYDCEGIEELLLKESRISVKNPDRSECVVLHCSVDINEIYELIGLLSEDSSFTYRIKFLKNSELPEYREVLSELALNELNPEQQAVYRGYMTVLLDMNHLDLWDMIFDFSESSGFDRLLRYYTDDVRKYIYDHITKRIAAYISEDASKE